MSNSSLRPRHAVIEGFSLDEAARMRQELMLHHQGGNCPRCGAPLAVLSGAYRGEELDVVECTVCGKSVLIYLPAKQDGPLGQAVTE